MLTITSGKHHSFVPPTVTVRYMQTWHNWVISMSVAGRRTSNRIP